MEFKDKIKSRRLELNMTLEDLAKKVGVSAPTIQRYESGEIKNVRRDKIKLLSDALQLTPAYLMGWDESPKSTNEIGKTTTYAAHKVDDEPVTEEEFEMIKAVLAAYRKNKK